MSTMPFGKYVDYEIETIPSDYLSYMLDLPGFIDNNEHLADQMQKELDVRENSNAHFYKRPYK